MTTAPPAQPLRREGIKVICELPEGTWLLAVWGKHIMAVCDDHAPRLIYPDGTVKILDSLR